MLNYWFLYNTSTGIITQPTLVESSQWTNIPIGQSVLGAFPQDTASVIVQDAFNHPSYYTVKSGVITALSTLTSLQLKDAKNAKIGELNSKCNATILAEFSSTALGVSHNYDFGEEAQRNLSGRLGLINANANYPASFSWKTTDVGVLTHTKAQFIQLCTDADTFKDSQVAKYWNLKAKVIAITDPTKIADVNAIIW